MFGIRRRKKVTNPEVVKAVAERDRAMEEAKEAIHKVDELKDDLIREYEEAEKRRWS